MNDVEDVLNTGYSVSGPAAEVDEYIKDKQVLGCDTLGGYKSAYLAGKPESVPNGLNVGKL